MLDELLNKFNNSQTDLEALVEEISQMIDKVQSEDYEQLSNDKKIEADLLVVYAINSLYFINLRINHVEGDFVKTELKRIQEAMKKLKQVKDKLTIMPRLDTEASKRFVRSALWVAPEKDVTPSNKKIRFDEEGNPIAETSS
uniref:Nuclear nucleic acid-binding protein C1D n=1 Tax=Cacopsylla melanoneura TaxID=428564 RepID=A0A8D8VY31_9HEMI